MDEYIEVNSSVCVCVCGIRQLWYSVHPIFLVISSPLYTHVYTTRRT